MVLTTLLTLVGAALGMDTDFDGGDADFDTDTGGSEVSADSEPTLSSTSSSGQLTFGAEEKPASELIIAANGQGFETPSEFITGSNPWEPKN